MIQGIAGQRCFSVKIVILLCAGIFMMGCAASSPQMMSLRSQVQEALEKADMAKMEAASAKALVNTESQKAEKSAQRAERAATRAEQARNRAESAANKAENMAQKCENIFNKCMSK